MTKTNTTTTTKTVSQTKAALNAKLVHSYDSEAEGLQAYNDLKSREDALKAQLASLETQMSDVCQSIVAQFGAKTYDLGDGNKNGSIAANRGSLFFFRGRNSGRPKGSKNMKGIVPAPVAPTESVETVVEAPQVDLETLAQAAEEVLETQEPQVEMEFETATVDSSELEAALLDLVEVELTDEPNADLEVAAAE